MAKHGDLQKRTISTSTSHEFEYWEFFFFGCMSKIIENHKSKNNSFDIL
jgi:hypothetical protein